MGTHWLGLVISALVIGLAEAWLRRNAKHDG